MSEQKDEQGRVVRQVSDSVFTHMLSIPQFTRIFYAEQHPEDADVTESDIEIVTIDNVMTNTIRNDLGFIVKDRLMVLAEAQKKWSKNIPLRMLDYYVKTLDRYIRDRKLNVHTSKALALPRPELYMVYSGDREQVQNAMTFSEIHFGGAKIDIDATVHVIQADGSHSLMDQFIRFSRIATETSKRLGRGKMGLLDLIERCKREDILTEYLNTRESEVATILESMLSWEYELAAMKIEGREEGRTEGNIEMLSKLLSAGAITQAIADKFMPKDLTSEADDR